MAINSELIVKINGDVKGYKKALDQVKGQTKELEQALGDIAKISGVAFAGLASGVGLATAQFAKFDNDIRGVRTLLDENSFATKSLEQGFKDMRQEALALGASLPVDVDKVTKALFDTVSAGVAAGEATQVVATSSKLAVAGLTDVAVATDGLTSALNAYQLGAGDADEVASKFFTAQKFGKTTIEELSSSFGLAGASAQAAGVGLDELLGAVSAVTTAGVRTQAAFTGLKAVVANVAKPTAEATKEAKRLGISFDAASLRSKGLEQFLNDLTEAQGFTKDSVTRLFGSVEAQGVAFALTGAQAGTFKNVVAELGDTQKSAATFTDAFNISQASLSNQFVKLKGTIQVAAIQIGERFAPAISLGVEALSNFVGIIANNPAIASFVAAIVAAGTAVTGFVFALSTGLLVFIKVRNQIIALNKALLITQTIMKANQSIIAAGSKAWKLLGTQVNFANIAQKAFAIASKATAVSLRVVGVAFRFMLGPIGLIITAIGLLAVAYRKEIQQFIPPAIDFLKTKWAELSQVITLIVNNAILGFNLFRVTIVASIDATLAAVVKFVDIVRERVSGLADVFRGILSGDLDKISSGLESLTGKVSGGFAEVGEAAAAEFNRSLNEGLQEFEGRSAEDVKIAQGATAPAGGAGGAGGESVGLPSREGAGGEAEKAVIEENKKILLANEDLSASLRALKEEEIELLEQLETEKGERTREVLMANLEENRLLQEEEVAQDLERREIINSEILAKNEEFQALSEEQKLEFMERNQELLLNEVMTEQEIRDEANAQRLKNEIESQNQFLRDKEKFGKTFAKLNKFINSEEVQGAKSANTELIQLTQSKNSTLKGIGKAASIANVVIKTAESAMNIFSGFSTIPIIGPALGIAGAAAAVAFGAEQIGQIKGARDGGRITGGIPGIDSVPALLTPGELVAPEKNFDEVVNAVADRRLAEEDTPAVTQDIMVGFDGDEAENVITIRQNEARALGIDERI